MAINVCRILITWNNALSFWIELSLLKIGTKFRLLYLITCTVYYNLYIPYVFLVSFGYYMYFLPLVSLNISILVSGDVLLK